MQSSEIANLSRNEFDFYRNELITKLFSDRKSVSKTQNGLIPRKGNIRGTAFGVKHVNGMPTEERSLIVYVRNKMPSANISSPEIPKSVNGIDTDVVSVGNVRAANYPSKARMRPAFGGSSGGHYLANGGTLGCIVTNQNGDLFWLSNNHVLANSNNSKAGDRILQQSVMDGASADKGDYAIALLSDFEKLRFGGADNLMDAAIARVINPASVNPEIAEIGRVSPGFPPQNMPLNVQKFGRSTGKSTGRLLAKHCDKWIGYGDKDAWLVDQVCIPNTPETFAAAGDSGSLIVDDSLRAVALLVGLSDGLVIATPIERVLTRFTVSIV